MSRIHKLLKDTKAFNHISTCTIVIFAMLLCCTSGDQSVPENTSSEDAVMSEFAKINYLIEQDTTDATLYALRGELLYQRESYDLAIVDLQKAILLAPRQVRYRHLLADVQMDYYKSRDALEVMKTAHELFPDSSLTALKLSEFQYILTQYADAIKTLDDLIQKDPSNPEAYFMLGLNFKALQDTGRAINSLQKAVDLDNDLVDGWIELGNLFAELENPIAIQYFDNALRVDSTNATALFAKAYYLQGQGELLQANTFYNKAISYDFRYEEAYINSGILWIEMDSLERAYQVFDRLEQIDRTQAKPYYYKGIIYQMQDQVETARSLYEQAIRLDPSYVAAQQAIKKLQ